MAKIADKYYVTDPWKITEKGFDPKYSMVSESIFSLGNEHMGVRGYFEEGYSGETLVGSYINGVYEESQVAASGYRGMIDKTYFMVNTVDWLYLKLKLDGEDLDLAKSSISEFVRELDMKTGVFTRSFVWHTASGKRLSLCFERFLSMDRPLFGGQRLTAKALNFDGELTVTAGLDFSKPHVISGANLWNVLSSNVKDNSCSLLAETKSSGKMVYAVSCFSGNISPQEECRDDKLSSIRFVMPLTQAKASCFTRVHQSVKLGDTKNPQPECERAASELKTVSYDTLLDGTKKWWNAAWAHSDIEIQGDDLNQQGIRFCIFQMHQTYHGAEPGTVIGAKGLTGEAYNGNTFWDTETYCLPFYIFNNPAAAKNLLMFRYKTLDKAKQRADMLDCKGAFYPVATINGEECCTLWQHASTQLQVSTAVAYGIWHYVKIIGDTEFLYSFGAEILVEICRMLVTRVDRNPRTGMYGYYGVMGPDEFQLMVNNNCYTNYMGRATLLYTLSVLDEMRSKNSYYYEQLCKKARLEGNELAQWEKVADNMFIPYDDVTGLFEQHEGFFGLPHINVDDIPTSDFPLYSHWSYDRIYRNDMIKQPDVLMLMLLYNSKFTYNQKLANYDYYEPRCIHESSLSPSVHSILACELKKFDEAYSFFGFTTRLDLDNYNRNTCEGLHMPSIAAAWMNIVYGFGGMRSDGDMISFAPYIPEQWGSYSFKLLLGGGVLTVKVGDGVVRLKMSEGTADILLYGEEISVSATEQCYRMME